MNSGNHGEPMDTRAHQQAYDAKYAGDYMDADAYSTWVHGGLAAQRVRQTLQQVPVVPARILDYGCGQGKWVGLLRSLYPQADIRGIDVSAVAIDKARKKHPDCRFLPFDGGRAPFDDAGFDLVFSFHVLEHVLDFAASVEDIARLVRPGGFACIIFPCGNVDSYEERLASLIKDGRQTSATGETIFFFERSEGHLRRVESASTISLFEQHGLTMTIEFYSGHFYASLDWLIRGTGPHYINAMFRGMTPASRYAALKLKLMHRLLLGSNRMLGYQHLDLKRTRQPLKQFLARLVRAAATRADRALLGLARQEWERRRKVKSGSVQYIIFQKRPA